MHTSVYFNFLPILYHHSNSQQLKISIKTQKGQLIFYQYIHYTCISCCYKHLRIPTFFWFFQQNKLKQTNFYGAHKLRQKIWQNFLLQQEGTFIYNIQQISKKGLNRFMKEQTQMERNEGKDKYTDLIQQYKKRGAKLQKIKISNQQAQGINIVASQKIEGNQIFLQIPERLMITQAKVKSQIQPKQLCQITFRSDHVIFALYLLIQKQKKEKSQIFHYIDCLPKDLSAFPLKYGQKYLNQLTGTSFLPMLNKKKEDLISDYKLLTKYFQKLTYQQFQDMLIIVNSRLFNIKMNGKQTQVLVPIADLLDNRTLQAPHWNYSQQKKIFYIRSFDCLIKEGQKIDMTYVRQSNSINLFFYGFTIIYNPRDTISLTLDGYKNKMRKLNVILSDSPYDANFAFMLAHCRQFATHQYNQQHNIMQQNQQIDVNQTHNKHSLTQLLQKYYQDSKNTQINKRTWQSIKSIMKDKIKQYPTTYDDDDHQLNLQKEKQENNNHNCYKLRMGQKYVLYKLKKFAKENLHQIKINMSQKYK